jgi:threonine dehydratase
VIGGGGGRAAACNALARQLAGDRGWELVDDFSNPHVMAGAGTLAVEVLDQRPGIDAFVVPLGGGALAAGCTAAIKGLAPNVTTVGVAGAPATYESWRAGRIVEAECHTIADGLAVDRPEAAPIATLRHCLDRGLLVSDEQLGDAVVAGIEVLHNLLEPSGAASLAALLAAPEEFAGREVAIVATGGNIALPVLRAVLDR